MPLSLVSDSHLSAVEVYVFPGQQKDVKGDRSSLAQEANVCSNCASTFTLPYPIWGDSWRNVIKFNPHSSPVKCWSIVRKARRVPVRKGAIDCTEVTAVAARRLPCGWHDETGGQNGDVHSSPCTSVAFANCFVSLSGTLSQSTNDYNSRSKKSNTGYTHCLPSPQ